VGKELEIRRILSESHLKSSAFDVKYLDADGNETSPSAAWTRLVLHGSGWGHGVGLCQIGAAVMATEGYGYKEILKHYYPHSELI
jgi:SpoIID/LytB domain protein